MVNREESRAGSSTEAADQYEVGENHQLALNGQVVVGYLKIVFAICSQL